MTPSKKREASQTSMMLLKTLHLHFDKVCTFSCCLHVILKKKRCSVAEKEINRRARKTVKTEELIYEKMRPHLDSMKKQICTLSETLESKIIHKLSENIEMQIHENLYNKENRVAVSKLEGKIHSMSEKLDKLIVSQPNKLKKIQDDFGKIKDSMKGVIDMNSRSLEKSIESAMQKIFKTRRVNKRRALLRKERNHECVYELQKLRELLRSYPTISTSGFRTGERRHMAHLMYYMFKSVCLLRWKLTYFSLYQS